MPENEHNNPKENSYAHENCIGYDESIESYLIFENYNEEHIMHNSVLDGIE